MKPTISRAFAGSLVLVAAVSVGTGFHANETLSHGDREAGQAASGTIVDLRSAVRLTSRQTKAGALLTATTLMAVLNGRGDTVIPVGATFAGKVLKIEPAAASGERGKILLAFNSVRLGEGDAASAIDTRVVSLGTHVEPGAQAAGWGGGVGRGNVHPREGEREIVLPAGGMIRLALTQPFAPEKSSAK